MEDKKDKSCPTDLTEAEKLELNSQKGVDLSGTVAGLYRKANNGCGDTRDIRVTTGTN